MTPTTKANVEDMERTAICTTSTNQRIQKQEKSHLWALESWNPANPLNGVEISFFKFALVFKAIQLLWMKLMAYLYSKIGYWNDDIGNLGF